MNTDTVKFTDTDKALATQDARIAELEAELTVARADLARHVAGIDAERESGRQVLTRLLALVEEWERADCTSMTLECAEQVRAILRGEGPMGWESREAQEPPKCATCNGEGVIVAKYWPRQEVTREMAMDAGDLSMAGSLYSDEEYEYEPCPDCAGKEGNGNA